MIDEIDAIKNFITDTVNEKIADYGEVEGLELPTISEVYTGAIDLDKKRASVLCCVIPESQEVSDNSDWNLDGFSLNTKMTVSFIATSALQSVLDARILAYAEIFRDAVLEDTNLDGEVDGCDILTITPYLDCGNIPGQVSAVEIEITIHSSKTI